MTRQQCVQLDHVLQMYHLGYHEAHRPTSAREPQVESAKSVIDQHTDSHQPENPSWIRNGGEHSIPVQQAAVETSTTVTNITAVTTIPKTQHDAAARTRSPPMLPCNGAPLAEKSATQRSCPPHLSPYATRDRADGRPLTASLVEATGRHS